MKNARNRIFPGFRTRRSSQQARRRQTLALEGLENRIVLTQIQYGLFDTGVDDAGNVLARGATDTHYTLPVTQVGTSGMNATVVSNLPETWVPNGATHAWIGPAADPSASPPGPYDFQTIFSVSSAGGGQLTGSIAADDDLVDILINGKSTQFTRTAASTSLATFSVTSGLVSGVNTIDFIVNNSDGAASSVGFHASELALNFLPTLTVDNDNINASSGSSVVNSGTFADPDEGDTVTITSDRGSIQQSGTNSGTYQYFEPNVTTGGTVTITATDSKGGVSTQTFTISSTPNQPPVLTGGGGGSNTARSGSAGVVIDPNITVSDADGPNLSSASVSISSASFVPAEDRLLFTDQNGITGNYNASTGILTLSGSATAADYQAALRSVQYQNLNGGSANTTSRSISFSIAPGAYRQANGHFYEFVSQQGITWTDAKAAADAQSIFGLKGYLATLTSQAENDFAFSKVQSVGWIGASDAAVEGEWRWADGPENGQLFFQGLGDGTGSAVNGGYNNWANGEPNNAGDEDYAHFLSSGEWNDYANNTVVQGYVVEYGGSEGDPTLQLTSVMDVKVVNVSNAPVVTAPTTPQLVNTATATITGTAQAGSLIQVYNDLNNNGLIDEGETVVASQQMDVGATSFSLAAPLTANMANSFIVTSSFGSDAESSPTVVPTITQDSLVPAIPTVTSPTQSTVVNTNAVTITGTAEAGSLVQIYNDVNNNGLIDEGDTVVASEQLDSDTSSFSLITPLSADMANHFLVAAADAAGNISAPAVVPTITQDSLAPAVPTITSPTQPTTANTNSVTITGTAEAGSLVQIYDDVNNNGLIDEGDTLVAAEQLDSNMSIYGLSAPLSADMANHFLVTVTDAAGNISAPAVVPTITQDSLAPAVPTVTSPTQPTVVSTNTISITGTAEAGSLIQIYNDVNNNGVIDEGDTVVASEKLDSDTSSFSLITPLSADMANHFLVAATDAAGNISAPAVVPTITQDSLAPAVPTITSPTQPTTANTNSVTITGTAEAGSLVQIYDDVNNNGVIDEDDTLVAAERLDSDTSSFSLITPLSADVANHFLVSATDRVGNISAAAIVPTITQDSLAPTVATLGSPASATTTTATTITLTGAAEAGSLVQVWGDTNNNGLVDDGEVVVGFAQLGPDETSYQITVPLAANVDNHFVITATDKAGNRSEPLVVPTISQSAFIQGTVFLDSNANGVQDASESPLADRVMYLDLNKSGQYDSSEPTTTTDASGHFAFKEYLAGLASVGEVGSLNTSNRYFVDQTTTLADGTLTVGVVPFSPIAPVPVVPAPFIKSSGSTANAFFAESLYRTVLGRTASPDEVGTWMVKMDNGMTMSQVANGFVNSHEHRVDQVTSFYRSFLHRAADPFSASWVNLLENGVSEQAVVRGILASQEYQAAHTDSNLYVRDLYLDVLGRQGSDSEVAAWESSLASGLKRNSLEAIFVGSAEAGDQIVNSDYTGYLRRKRESGSSNVWTNLLSRGVSAGDVAIGILSSNEYVAKAKASTLS